MKKFIWLLIFSLQLFPVLQNNRLVMGTATYAQENVGEEDPLDDANCMKQVSSPMYSGGGMTVTSVCNVWSDCETKEFDHYGDCSVDITYPDPPDPTLPEDFGNMGGSGGGDSGGSGSTGSGSGGGGGTGSGVGTGGGGSGGGYVPPTSYPGSGIFSFAGYSFSSGISSATTNFLFSGAWSLSASANPNPVVTSEVLNLYLNFTVTIPADVSSNFLNNPVCEFVVVAYHPGLSTMIGGPQTISLSNVTPGQTASYSGTLTFNPTSITQVAMYWNQEPVQIMINGGLKYPSATGGSNGQVLGAISFTGKVP
ncbi:MULTISPECIES: hypothetical protein [Niastella]|uniref:Uncharacterized protein n=1 Tax=Niastella soli TaxID=2821487 RepID=A0ABS3Z356_9BACT|nr:hypothetical protein [Niastella soli]MBO9203831.1 hypothetical protein [Niastella soli]